MPETENDARLAEAAARARDGTALGDLDLSGCSFTAADLVSEHALDFASTCLRGATFMNLDLSDASFSGADLSGAAFHNVNLMRVDFDRCAGRGALFTDVNLAYARFEESDLRGSLFFDANMADINFKGAALEGSQVDAIRLSLNGSTHVLGLKEALRSLAGEESYPYIVGASGDAFWMTYYVKTGDLNWGGLARDVLRRGLENFGFECSFLDEVEEDAAWDALTAALAEGATVITPLHVSRATLLGGGFGGAEWVFVTGIDRGEVLVNCLLGDRLRFTRERFREGWCMHHPMEASSEDIPIIYAMCVVGKRHRIPPPGEITRAGLRAGVEVMELGTSDRVALGFDAYTHLVDDLLSHHGPEDLPPDEARRFLPWLGLGVLHHHGSRWAIRDFLVEALDRGEFAGDDRKAVAEAHELYGEVCTDLQKFLELMPWTLDLQDGAQRAAAIEGYQAHRREGADLLRRAAALERDALERFKAVIDPASPSS